MSNILNGLRKISLIRGYKIRYFFTADTHFGHENIIRYCQRPFKSVTHMDRELLRRWNERVKKEDVVFIVGDFCFKNSKGGKRGEGLLFPAIYWKSKLNGSIIPIKGNHDRNNSNKTIIERLVISYGRKRVNLVHNPDHIDINYEINFTAHVHNHWKIKRVKRGQAFTDCINVGVDVWNFYPVTFEEIMSRYAKWKRNIKI